MTPLASCSPPAHLIPRASWCRPAPGQVLHREQKGLLIQLDTPKHPQLPRDTSLVSEPPGQGCVGRLGLGVGGTRGPALVAVHLQLQQTWAQPPLFGVSFGNLFFSLPALCSVASGLGSGLDWGGVLQMVLPPLPRPWPHLFCTLERVSRRLADFVCSEIPLLVTSRGLGPLLSAPTHLPLWSSREALGCLGADAASLSLRPQQPFFALVTPLRPSLSCWCCGLPKPHVI